MFTMPPRTLGFAAAGLFVLALAGCASDEAPAGASPFAQALSKDYMDLAAQAATAPAPDSNESFFENPFGLFGSPSNPADLLVTAFNDKASLAQQGQHGCHALGPAVDLRLVRSFADVATLQGPAENNYPGVLLRGERGRVRVLALQMPQQGIGQRCPAAQQQDA